MEICVQNRINVSDEDNLKRLKVYKSLRRVLKELLEIRKRSARYISLLKVLKHGREWIFGPPNDT